MLRSVAKHMGYAILNADLLRTGGVKPVRAEKLSFDAESIIQAVLPTDFLNNRLYKYKYVTAKLSISGYFAACHPIKLKQLINTVC